MITIDWIAPVEVTPAVTHYSIEIKLGDNADTNAGLW
jgi:hypothetical protein